MKLNMVTRLLILALLLGLFAVPRLIASSPDSQAMLTMINGQLESTHDPKGKAKLYCYRARNYAKSGDLDKAKDDYLTALNSSYEGWILQELGLFMYTTGQYEKAYNVSVKVLKDFPYLKNEASKLKMQSKNKWDEEYLENNPPTITLDTVPDPNRLTRHGLIKQAETRQGAQNSSKTQSGQSAKPVYKYWGTHPKTKNIPEPKQRNFDY
jgi:tetratricopeptide (TPR) repeat protein